MSKKNPPCIRNLEKFKKVGCPKKQWDGEEGCPAWIELSVATKENPNKREIKNQQRIIFEAKTREMIKH